MIGTDGEREREREREREEREREREILKNPCCRCKLNDDNDRRNIVKEI